jgi:hypothetical protein
MINLTGCNLKNQNRDLNVKIFLKYKKWAKDIILFLDQRIGRKMEEERQREMTVCVLPFFYMWL